MKSVSVWFNDCAEEWVSIIENDLNIGLDDDEHVESIVLLSKLKSNKLKHINVEYK